MQKTDSFVLQDIAIVFFSIIIAILLETTGLLHSIINFFNGYEFIESFIAGLFFTSIFTTIPAIISLGEIAQHSNPFWTAVFGGLGAVIGDLIIFRFVRDRLSEDIMNLLRQKTSWFRVCYICKSRLFKFMTFFVGGLIIASPLPDELGIALLGFSKMEMKWFIPISYIFNFIGILLIGVVAKAIE